jgi:hopanoid biosynthesis associated protein HpnK
MDEKLLIVTADDFGISREVNAGVLQAHREGILTATSLMVAGGARNEAAAIARENPGLDVGLHLVLCRGYSASDAARANGLGDAAGAFPQNPVKAGMRYYFDRRIRSALRDEIRAQIERHLEIVGYLNHLDGHLNFHVHPVILDLLIEAAREYRIPCMRLPREPVFQTLALSRDHAGRKLIEAAIFHALSRRARRLFEMNHIRTSDWLFGLHQTGYISEEYVSSVIARLRPGVTEFYFHPAANTGGTPPMDNAQLEVEVLTSPRIRNEITSNAVRLTNFGDLAHSGAIRSSVV